MDIEGEERVCRIRDLNDALRRTFSGGEVMLTSGVNALPDLVKGRRFDFSRPLTSSTRRASRLSLIRELLLQLIDHVVHAYIDLLRVLGNSELRAQSNHSAPLPSLKQHRRIILH